MDSSSTFPAVSLGESLPHLRSSSPSSLHASRITSLTLATNSLPLSSYRLPVNSPERILYSFIKVERPDLLEQAVADEHVRRLAVALSAASCGRKQLQREKMYHARVSV